MATAIDPIALAEEAGKIVGSGEKRKYYRFRPAFYYGGIATADCVGCCLKCLFCWSWHIVTQPEKTGRFYSPEEVARNLVSIARKKGFHQVRISGNEPTLHRSHLLKVLELIPKEIRFILETNGILIGYDSSYAKDLSRFPHLYVRVSLKGACPEDFTRLTKAKPEGFHYQLKALEHLVEEGVDCFPAVMANFSSQEEIKKLRQRLKGIRSDFEDFEEEELILYPFVQENLKKAGISYSEL
ncbi:MAG: molybdenum cofactor biosynthesis protein MoaA [Deltaproteobacteria bacterium CG_4_8_14_3_um_filter_45_9]|nr:MAG: molybdenum cofactor biosynthesis protein MoaA [Deltaproteobacteria bacterium CG_4_8_14_3_um_filter_45_9]